MWLVRASVVAGAITLCAAAICCTSFDSAAAGQDDDGGHGGGSDDASGSDDGASATATDASDASEAGATVWACGEPICDDFERDAVVRDGWTAELNGGDIEIDPTQSNQTPHRSLRARVGTGGGSVPRVALFESPFQNAHHVRCSFSLLVNDPGPPDNTIDLFLISGTAEGRAMPSSIRFGISGTVFDIRQDVHEADGSCSCPTASPFYFGSVAPSGKPPGWRRVTVDTTLTQATVTFDGTISTYTFEDFPLLQAQIQIGIYDFGSDTGDFSFDDLACEVD